MTTEPIPWADAVREALRLDPNLSKADIARALGISDAVCAYRLEQSGIEVKLVWRLDWAGSLIQSWRKSTG